MIELSRAALNDLAICKSVLSVVLMYFLYSHLVRFFLFEGGGGEELGHSTEVAFALTILMSRVPIELLVKMGAPKSIFQCLIVFNGFIT